jgi:hypothetical protein
MGTCVRDTPRIHPRKGTPDEGREGPHDRRDRGAAGDLAADDLLLGEGCAVEEGTADDRRPADAQQGHSLRYKLLRDAAYKEGQEQYDELAMDRTFRDFVCMYIGEGSKRNRNEVAICNSGPRVVFLSDYWIRCFAKNPVRYSLQYHADQDVDELKRFWSDLLNIEPAEIAVQRKSNSNRLTGRTWRSRYGVLTVRSGDTYFRARLQAWIDRTTYEWLDCFDDGA